MITETEPFIRFLVGTQNSVVGSWKLFRDTRELRERFGFYSVFTLVGILWVPIFAKVRTGKLERKYMYLLSYYFTTRR